MTYSIVARDPETGQLGVAVQSRWFSVGRTVTWAEPGVGAVATQSFADPSYGPEGLARMRAGASAADALAELVAADPGAHRRQVAMVDARGRVAAHTGSGCVRAAGHLLADGISAQANMMERDSVWAAMVEAFEAAPGPLAERLLAALEAAEAEGGDVRGRQSAALLVVAAEPTGDPHADRPVELRVEDHPLPLPELRRLLVLRRGYDLLSRATELVREGDGSAALAAALPAIDLCPDDDQVAFFAGLVLAGTGRLDDARPLLERAYAAEPRWAELLRRLPEAGLLPDDPALLARLGPGSPGRGS
jgi:uncharacterized Ntn-hydrolase superfamily protein